MSDEYRVQLDVFSGPLDLLLYLIRRDELDIQDIPIARLTEQYLQYVHLLERIDPNSVGDFLVMASSLIEIKSRALLPTPPLEPLDDSDDPRAMLVRQLLEYKAFKDAARSLAESAEERSRRFVRRPADLPPELAGIELEEVEVWDLLAAFNRVMTAIGKGPGVHDVRYDETPIERYQSIIIEMLERGGPGTFDSLFDRATTKAELVGTFLALLELMRQQRVRVEQDRVGGVIYLFLIEEVAELAPEEDVREDSPAAGRAPEPSADDSESRVRSAE